MAGLALRVAISVTKEDTRWLVNDGYEGDNVKVKIRILPRRRL
jgi:hypothetical protein